MAKVALVSHWDWVLHHFRLPVARALRDHGCEVLMVCPEGELSGSFVEEGLRHVPWHVVRRGTTPASEIRAVAALAGIYRRERPTVVHHYTVKPSLYGSLAALSSPATTVINMFSGLGYLFSDAPHAARLRRAVLPAARLALRFRKTWTVTCTASDLRHLQALGLAAAARSAVIPDGVDVQRYRPRDVALSHDRTPVVVLACRLLAEKGVPEFVAAARALLEGGSRTRFVVAGEPDDGNPGAISRVQLDAWAREGAVEFLGNVQDTAPLLRDADIAVLPTRYGEGTPLSLIEAMACGLPVVATDVPGCRALVEDGVNGLLVPVGNSQALAEAVGRLVDDPLLRVRLGDAGRAMAVRGWSVERVVEDNLALYREVGAVL